MITFIIVALAFNKVIMMPTATCFSCGLDHTDALCWVVTLSWCAGRGGGLFYSGGGGGGGGGIIITTPMYDSNIFFPLKARDYS